MIHLVTLKTVRIETSSFIFTSMASLVVTPCSDVQSEVDMKGVSSRKSTCCESIMEFDSLIGILRLLSFG